MVPECVPLRPNYANIESKERNKRKTWIGQIEKGSSSLRLCQLSTTFVVVGTLTQAVLCLSNVNCHSLKRQTNHSVQARAFPQTALLSPNPSWFLRHSPSDAPLQRRQCRRRRAPLLRGRRRRKPKRARGRVGVGVRHDRAWRQHRQW